MLAHPQVFLLFGNGLSKSLSRGVEGFTLRRFKELEAGKISHGQYRKTGRQAGREKGEEVKEMTLPHQTYFSTIASTGQTSEQLPHSVHFSSLIT
jgi:hypothetical protein